MTVDPMHVIVEYDSVQGRDCALLTYFLDDQERRFAIPLDQVQDVADGLLQLAQSIAEDGL